MKISFPGATFEVGPNVVAIAALLVPMLMVLAQGYILYKAKQTHEEVKEVAKQVKTANGKSIAELADASETRRIADIPINDRTEAEDEHLISVPEIKE